ncbi:hypothetical protein FV222_00220 [Methylobacterium sp. WL103]|uniref:hypothetical protein n=1 Tax=Methylobacterium sp. WL103 TaxID=2603891 RepID=UPI0011C83853|nr:hypothetical protein [Methylobacterium sp. WL103]TXN08931.1 hypothetical protein FV222_00220 [Methylobacterium sp. WL103]
MSWIKRAMDSGELTGQRADKSPRSQRLTITDTSTHVRFHSGDGQIIMVTKETARQIRAAERAGIPRAALRIHAGQLSIHEDELTALVRLTPHRMLKEYGTEIRSIRGRFPDEAPSPEPAPLVEDAVETRAFVNIWKVTRERTAPVEEGRIEEVMRLALNEQGAFAQLIQLSGLDAMEIEEEELTLVAVGTVSDLCERLKELTGGDIYGFGQYEVPLPLPDEIMAALQA